MGRIRTDKVRGEGGGGEAFTAVLPDQRPAGCVCVWGGKQGYQGKNNTLAIQSSRHQRGSKREGRINRGGG